MELKEFNNKAREMLANFVNEIGLDGEAYLEANGRTPVTFGKTLVDSDGEYMTPESRRLEKFLSGKKINEKTETVIRNRGLILLNEKYKGKEPDADMYVTLIHETIHSYRNLLFRDAYRDEDFSSFVSNDQKIEQNTNNLRDIYGDASQDILKGSIDDSKDAISKYANIDDEYVEEIIDLDEELPEQMERQKVVDESLVDMIAAISYKLYEAKERGEKKGIWEQLETIKEKSKGEDIGYMAEIILKHKDFELFNWMLDPISYSSGDIHYDFFGEYTKNDKELVEKLYSAERPDFEEDFGALLRNDVKDSDEISKEMDEDKTEKSYKKLDEGFIK